jgi:hypothetical protein
MTLIDRLSKLDGPDREVDAEICILLQYGGKNSEGALNVRTDPEWGDDDDLLYELDGDPCCAQIPKLTASVDAAIALARRLWPDVMYRVGNHAEGYDPSLYLGELFIPGEKQSDYFTGVASTNAIALCIAILRAKEAANGND